MKVELKPAQPVLQDVVITLTQKEAELLKTILGSNAPDHRRRWAESHATIVDDQRWSEFSGTLFHSIGSELRRK